MIEFKVENLDEIERKFKKWGKKVSAPKDILNEFGKHEVERVKARFGSKSDPDGGKWTQWDRDTEEERQREGTSSTGLLFETGALYNSIQYQVSGNKVTIGTNVEYAQYLQDGTVNMPPREFLGFNDRSAADISWLIETVFDG